MSMSGQIHAVEKYTLSH